MLGRAIAFRRRDFRQARRLPKGTKRLIVASTVGGTNRLVFVTVIARPRFLGRRVGGKSILSREFVLFTVAVGGGISIRVIRDGFAVGNRILQFVLFIATSFRVACRLFLIFACG